MSIMFWIYSFLGVLLCLRVLGQILEEENDTRYEFKKPKPRKASETVSGSYFHLLQPGLIKLFEEYTELRTGVHEIKIGTHEKFLKEIHQEFDYSSPEYWEWFRSLGEDH